MDDDLSLSHTRWNCKYHIVFIPKYRKSKKSNMLLTYQFELRVDEKLSMILGNLSFVASKLFNVDNYEIKTLVLRRCQPVNTPIDNIGIKRNG